MNYEEKYEKALERARKLHSEPTGGTERIVCEQIFPELMESEDERIRKELLDYLKERQIIEGLTDTKVKMDWVTWLEKQGLQNEDEEMFDMTEINLRELRDRFGEKYGRVGDCIAWLKFLKERFGCEANCTTKKSKKIEKHLDIAK